MTQAESRSENFIARAIQRLPFIHRYLDGRPYLRRHERLIYFIIAVIAFVLSLWGLLAPA
jgi:quinol-cytochrome oxidoreductase complex cytochrome b subunit